MDLNSISPGSAGRAGVVVIASLLMLPAARALATDASSSASQEPMAATEPTKVPKYPVSYEPPTAEQIQRTLDHVRARLEVGTGTRIIDSKTHEPIADLSKPLSGAVLDAGPERKFSSYSYPMGVIYNGMLLCAEATRDKRYADFVAKRFGMFADNLPALASWPKEDMRRNPFRNMLAPSSLDACGAIGASMIRARRQNVGPDLQPVIERFAEYVTQKQFRLDDGTLARNRPFPRSLWLDDAYMSVSLLSQMGKLTGERKYFDDAAHQLVQFHHYLFVPEIKLFTHAGVPETLATQPHYYWGRANGWYMVALAELLDLMPEDHPQRAELIKILNDHAQGVATVQSGTGLWHQMLDRPDSYLETSCSAMFTYAMAKGVNRGWLSAEQYGPVAQAGWNGVVRKISDDGRIDGTCIGTNYAADYVYYYNRPATDDVHGYGPTLLAGAEMLKLVKNERIHISSSPSNSTMYLDRNQKAGKE